MNSIDRELLELTAFFIPRVLVAALCGLIIGYDRQRKQKVAGIRTNILICVGCAIYTSASIFLTESHSEYDPTRIIAQIVTGIGFLGAGVIVKHEDKIVGVTTAAFIWFISSIGVLAGIGSVVIPILLTILMLFTTRFFEHIEDKLKIKRRDEA